MRTSVIYSQLFQIADLELKQKKTKISKSGMK